MTTATMMQAMQIPIMSSSKLRLCRCGGGNSICFPNMGSPFRLDVAEVGGAAETGAGRVRILDVHLSCMAGHEEPRSLLLQLAVLGRDPGDERRDHDEDPEDGQDPVRRADAVRRRPEGRAGAESEEVAAVLE